MKEELGKLEKESAENIIFKNCGFPRKEVSTGPGFGLDVSVVDLPGEMGLISTSDPLSLIPSLGLEESAWLSVHLMANDMATTGFAPMFAHLVLNLPATLSMQDFKIYWEYIHQFSKEIGVSITGGHTGFIEGQNSTISGGGTFFTVAPKKDILLSRNARPTDVILVTKQCAISSTSILAMSFPKTTINKLGTHIYEEASRMFYRTSSLKDGLIAAGRERKHKEVTAMHDVTEGGVLGAIYELVTASGNGAVIQNDQLPIDPVQGEICQLFSMDPRYCIGAGSMIITCEQGKEQQVIDRLQKEHIPCTAVGELVEKERGINLRDSGMELPLNYVAEDPHWGAFFAALEKGWK